MGLQSILNDFCLCSRVAIKSDATQAIGVVHSCSDKEKSDIWLLETRSEKIRVSKITGLESPSDGQTTYLGPEALLRVVCDEWTKIENSSRGT